MAVQLMLFVLSSKPDEKTTNHSANQSHSIHHRRPRDGGDHPEDGWYLSLSCNLWHWCLSPDEW